MTDSLRPVLRALVLLSFFVLTLMTVKVRTAEAAGGDPREWQELKGHHFVIFFQSTADRSAAETLLRKAEEYYRTIADQLGYTRYGNFWTWDDRAKVFLFENQKAFQETTRQPAWSLGYSDRDQDLFHSRTIVTYKQEQNFYDELLPHEISHLILHDFVPEERLPMWFDEGVAQLQETSKSGQAAKIMKKRLAENSQYPCADLADLDIRKERDTQKVMTFYAQSLSMVEFLLTSYGNDSFGRLCRNLRDGKNFEESLRNAYNGQIESMNELEKKWILYIRR